MNRGIQDRRDSGLKGYGKEWIQEKTKGQKVCGTGGMQERYSAESSSMSPKFIILCK